MNYFLSMKIHDNNNEIPLMSEHSEDIAVLVNQAETMFEFLTRHKSWDRAVIDSDFNSKRMSDAAMDVINGKSIDFEWSFVDKYDRTVTCYITSNI